MFAALCSHHTYLFHVLVYYWFKWIVYFIDHLLCPVTVFMCSVWFWFWRRTVSLAERSSARAAKEKCGRHNGHLFFVLQTEFTAAEETSGELRTFTRWANHQPRFHWSGCWHCPKHSGWVGEERGPRDSADGRSGAPSAISYARWWLLLRIHKGAPARHCWLCWAIEQSWWVVQPWAMLSSGNQC